ncbi:oligosaccharide flippase family protein, partial [Vibrio splendidus]|uniref:oligosaccharide flippase family protein n=1 Tax=Vibrio splendidus TaxID=29497 RepID=UPI003BAE8256
MIRKLGPDVYGIILLSQASVFFVSLFVDFGFNLSATKSVARNRLSAEKLANIVCLTILSKIILFSISMFI